MKEENKNLTEQNINLNVPVIIGYPVIDDYLREKLVGEMISKENSDGEKSNYAQILDVTVEKSELDNFDLCLNISLQTLTSLFKNKKVDILFYASFDLNKDQQKISLKDYEIDGKTKSWIADKLLETVVNKWMYHKLKKKMNVDLMPKIEEHLKSLNEKLENKIEAREGVHILGSMQKLEISELKAGETHFWISVRIEGNGLVEITELKF